MNARIPNIFHFVFGLKKQTEPLHLVYYLCLRSCLEINQPEKIYFYIQHEPYGYYWELIKPELTLVPIEPNSFVSNFHYEDSQLPQYSYAHHSDFIRLEKLLERGGVYADMDTIFVQKLPDQLFEHPFVLGRERDIIDPNTGKSTPSLCNAFIMSEPGSKFGELWLEKMTEAFDGTWSNHSTLLPRRLAEQNPEQIHVEPIRSFHGFDASSDGLFALFEDWHKDLDGIYSVHLCSHLWWASRRVDFTGFHAGMISERQIQIRETTYNLLARPFIPERPLHQQRWLMVANLFRQLRNWLIEKEQQGRVLAKFLVYNVLPKRLAPNKQQHLAFAKCQRAYQKACKNARAKSSSD